MSPGFDLFAAHVPLCTALPRQLAISRMPKNFLPSPQANEQRTAKCSLGTPRVVSELLILGHSPVSSRLGDFILAAEM